MRELRKKLHSQSGASILLALLFLLVCMMTAASVLTAASSNAGKIQSNYEEQQRYLALSSALRLVANQLEQAEYRGRYTVDKWTEIETLIGEDGQPLKDENGNDIKEEKPYYKIVQRKGLFTCGQLARLKMNADGSVYLDGNENPVEEGETVLTFRKEMDGLFAKSFTGTGYDSLAEIDGEAVAELPTNPPDLSEVDHTTRVLTVTVEGDGEIGKRFGSVKVTVDMDQSRRIRLKAELEAGSAGTLRTYTMEAELAPKGNMPAIEYPEENRLPKDGREGNFTNDNPPPDTSKPAMETTKTAVGWRLDWIGREVKEEKKGAGG